MITWISGASLCDCHPEHIRFAQCKLREGSPSIQRPKTKILRPLRCLRMTTLICFAMCTSLSPLLAQTNPKFNVSLRVDYTAAQQMLDLFSDEPVNTTSLAALRGNLIAASTKFNVSLRVDYTAAQQMLDLFSDEHLLGGG